MTGLGLGNKKSDQVEEWTAKTRGITLCMQRLPKRWRRVFLPISSLETRKVLFPDAKCPIELKQGTARYSKVQHALSAGRRQNNPPLLAIWRGSPFWGTPFRSLPDSTGIAITNHQSGLISSSFRIQSLRPRTARHVPWNDPLRRPGNPHPRHRRWRTDIRKILFSAARRSHWYAAYHLARSLRGGGLQQLICAP